MKRKELSLFLSLPELDAHYSVLSSKRHLLTTGLKFRIELFLSAASQPQLPGIAYFISRNQWSFSLEYPVYINTRK